MMLNEYYVTFPDGEVREINHSLQTGILVDINARLLALPLPTNRMIAYRVSGMRTRENRGIIETGYLLEQLNAAELLEYL